MCCKISHLFFSGKGSDGLAFYLILISGGFHIVKIALEPLQVVVVLSVLTDNLASKRILICKIGGEWEQCGLNSVNCEFY
ncbi:MAG: hypothetical protein H6Q14_1081 [Bacteroidetes bacterium]|nr:hypothetical protein [Bacteroidota bacterium]